MSELRNTAAALKARFRFLRSAGISSNADDYDYEDISDDVNATIPLKYLRSVLRNIGGRLTSEEIDSLMPQSDFTEPGSKISATEFTKTMMFVSLVICVFDRGGEGSISTENLVKALDNFTSADRESELRQLVESEKRNPDDAIHYDDFMLLIKLTR